jgi:hypothetical protein
MSNTIDLTSLEFWRDQYQNEETGLDEPYASQAWTEATVFLWCKIVTPVAPGLGAPSGFWSVFPDKRVLAGVLRYVLLPDWFGVLLAREDWDDDPDGFIAFDALIEAAVEAGKVTAESEDVAQMRAVMACLDDALAAKDEALPGFADQAVEAFNDRWSSTSDWEFHLEIFPKASLVANEILERRLEFLGDDPSEKDIEEELGVTRDIWVTRFASSIADEDARQAVLEALEEDAF